jgi:hypothetical protein
MRARHLSSNLRRWGGSAYNSLVWYSFREPNDVSVILEQVEAFRAFAVGRISSDANGKTIEDLFDEWLSLNLSPDEIEANANAIGEALRDFDNGASSQSWEEFDCEFRAKRGI